MIFRNAFVTKRQTGRLRREAFGVRRIPALCESSARREAKAPEYGALQTLRAVRLRLCLAVPRWGQARPTVVLWFRVAMALNLRRSLSLAGVWKISDLEIAEPNFAAMFLQKEVT